MLTNDDGIDAPGIKALERACREWSEIIVVAPAECHSSMSHHVNTEEPIGVSEISASRFRAQAGPADCARLARTVLAKDAGRLISGINRGGNLGMDTCYSGTVAAAREAALLGWPAIAISHFVSRGREVDWGIAAVRAERVLRQLAREELGSGEFWNVNLPHPAEGAPEPETIHCELDPCPLPVSYRIQADGYRYSGEYLLRDRVKGSDVDLCFAGWITVTRMRCVF